MKWIQIKNPKWIGRLAEEDVIPKSKTKPKASHEEDRDNWPEVDRRKRSAFEADRWRGSELDDGSDVNDGRAGDVERVSLRNRSELDDGGDVERVSLRGLRWEMTVNEKEWMRVNETGFEKIKKKKKKKKRKQVVPYWSELDDGGDIKRVELERNERWTRESENESERMTGFDKMNKK